MAAGSADRTNELFLVILPFICTPRCFFDRILVCSSLSSCADGPSKLRDALVARLEKLRLNWEFARSVKGKGVNWDLPT